VIRVGVVCEKKKINSRNTPQPSSGAAAEQASVTYRWALGKQSQCSKIVAIIVTKPSQRENDSVIHNR